MTSPFFFLFERFFISLEKIKMLKEGVFERNSSLIFESLKL